MTRLIRGHDVLSEQEFPITTHLDDVARGAAATERAPLDRRAQISRALLLGRILALLWAPGGSKNGPKNPKHFLEIHENLENP